MVEWRCCWWSEGEYKLTDNSITNETKLVSVEKYRFKILKVIKTGTALDFEFANTSFLSSVILPHP